MSLMSGLQGYPHGPQGHPIWVLRDIHIRHGLPVPDQLPVRPRDPGPTAEEKAIQEAWHKRELEVRARAQARVRAANNAAIARTANSVARVRARVLRAETRREAGRILQEALFVPSDLSIEVWLRWSAPRSGGMLELVAFEVALPRTFNLHVKAAEVGSVLTGPHKARFRPIEQLRVRHVRVLDVSEELGPERAVYVTPDRELFGPLRRTANVVLHHGGKVILARRHAEEPASRWSVVREADKINEGRLAHCIAGRLGA